MKHYDVIIIGGGAAGFFGAINIAQLNPDLKVAILERGKEVLTKVKVSGGGRCNVTHAEFDPRELVKYYPRGEKELLGPFHKFMTGDTIGWFEERGVTLKIEDDGRMFPVTNSSQTIIDCFLNETHKLGVEVLKNQAVKSIEFENDIWNIATQQDLFFAKKLLVTSGSNVKVWGMLQNLGHSIVSPVPSLFTFNINDQRIKSIPGVVAKHATVKVLDSQLESEGPLLVTHVGMSAPSILKLSAFGALELARRNYKFKIAVNFISIDKDSCLETLKASKAQLSRKTIYNSAQFELPKRLWQQLVLASHISKELRWADINREQLEGLVQQLTHAEFTVNGKSTFKEEFVTAGGVELKEIDFKTFRSKLYESLYFAGEVLNIDAVTGGFNFQNAWTGAYIAAQHISK